MKQMPLLCSRHPFIIAGCDDCDTRRRLLERQVAAMNSSTRDGESVDAAVSRICNLNERGRPHARRAEDDPTR